MKLAVIFNGQGAHFSGMGQDFVNNNEQAKAVYDLAESVTQKPLLEWSMEGTEALKQTSNAQPTIVATSLAIYESIKKQLPVISYMAGLSLGEYSALMASGSLSYEEGFALVNQRGELMSKHFRELSEESAIQMAAVINMPLDLVQALISEIHSVTLPLYLANYNSPQQFVIAGSKEAVKIFRQEAKKADFRKVIPLKVEGPFHTPLMAEVQDNFANYLNEVQFSIPSIPVVSNVDVKPHDIGTIRERLTEHIAQPVRWYQTIDWLVEQEVTHLIQIGPGNTLAKLLRDDKRVEVLVVDQWDDQEKIASFLNKEEQ